MDISDKIKQLIADGKTLDALDALQKFLKNKDENLLNQTYLLEAQYKEIQQKIRLGLQDATPELNRINFTILNLCDDIKNLNPNTEKEDAPDTQNNTSSINPFLVFGVIATIAIAVVFFLIYSIGNNKAATISGASQKENTTASTSAATSKNTTAVQPIEPPKKWTSMPIVVALRDRYYGDYKVDIKSITSQPKDANTETLKITLKFTCLKAYSGTCLDANVRFAFVTPNGNSIASIEDGLDGDMTPQSSNRQSDITFDIPQTATKGDLHIYYVDKKESSNTIVKLAYGN